MEVSSALLGSLLASIQLYCVMGFSIVLIPVMSSRVVGIRASTGGTWGPVNKRWGGDAQPRPWPPLSLRIRGAGDGSG